MTIKLTPKQSEYITNAHHRWNLSIGAVRSGKSHIAIQYIIPKKLRQFHGLKGINLILGATKENIERNVLTPMRDIWGAKLISDINTRNWATIFGEKVYCLGAEKVTQVSKLRGSEIKFCYCDEICDINEEVFEMLKSRLSLPYSECHAAANPASPMHFVKRFIDSAEDGVDIYCQTYTLYDNPFLAPQYVRSLEIEYAGTVYYDRYIKGLWTQAEGLIYPNYAASYEPAYDGDVVEWCVSIDYGTQNAFAALKWGKSPDGCWHAIDEYRYSGRDTGHQKTDSDYVSDMVDFCGDIDSAYVMVIVDPSASSFIAALKRCEARRFKVKHANNDVADGLRDTAVSMQLGLIKIADDLHELDKEFAGYVWDSSGTDRPEKVNDHLMDALRYFVKTMRVYRPKQDYTSILEKGRNADGIRQDDYVPRF